MSTSDGRAKGGTVVVVAGGARPGVIPPLPPDAWIIGADSGVGHALALGWRVDQAIGDFDSIAPEDLAAVREAGGICETHLAEKNATDLELALDAAARRHPVSVLVIGGHGGRFDHHLGNVLLLANPRFSQLRITAYMGDSIVTVIHGGQSATLSGMPGQYVSLLPIHGDAHGVTTTNLRYPLTREMLIAGNTRGVSNEFMAPTCTISLEAGALVAVQPLSRSDRG